MPRAGGAGDAAFVLHFAGLGCRGLRPTPALPPFTAEFHAQPPGDARGLRRIAHERSRRFPRRHRRGVDGSARWRFRPICPSCRLRDTVLFPNSFMPLAVAREASVRLIDEATSTGRMIGVFTQREAVGRGTAPGRSLSDRHRHAHPQDVQAARRQPAADRAGAGARAPRSDRADASLPARGRYRRRRECSATRIISRSTRCSATSRATSSRWCRCRRCSPTTCRRWPPTSPIRASSPTSSPRA